MSYFKNMPISTIIRIFYAKFWEFADDTTIFRKLEYNERNIFMRINTTYYNSSTNYITP